MYVLLLLYTSIIAIRIASKDTRYPNTNIRYLQFGKT